MHKRGPIIKKRKRPRPLDGNPFLKGIVLKTLIKKPRKPNSANRKCVLLRLSNGKEVTAYVPGKKKEEEKQVWINFLFFFSIGFENNE